MHSPNRRGPYRRKSIEERFWPKVLKSDGCWLWIAGLTSTGYGQFPSGGHERYGARPLKAHRVAWELTYGPIPPNTEIRHKCNTPRCVRPDHLELGTHADNMADMSRAGYHSNRKLTMEQAREIRQLHTTGIGAHRLGKQFGIAKKNVFLILSGKHYREP